MAKLPALRFSKRLNKEGVSPLYVFEGEDEALLSGCLISLRKALESDEMPGSMTTELGEVEDPRDVFDELRTQPFMGMQGKRLVVVREGRDFIAEHKDVVLDYVNNPSDFGVLAICCDKLDRRYKAAKALSQSATIVDCSRIRWKEARRWVADYAQEHGKEVSGQALYSLLQAVGADIRTLRNEIEKLILYADQEELITEEHVEELVPHSRSRSIFDLSHAITQGNTSEAIRLGQDLLRNGEQPERIVAFLGHRIRQLWQIRRMTDERQSPSAISRELGMPNWAAKKAAQSVTDLSEEWFMRIVGIVARADVELKSTSVQSREREVWLNRFLSRVCEE
ncbi:MAG: DNA polymerase III subunit delta [Planctomycetota bacterium]